MQALLTSAETRALDRATEERGIPVSLLMERAGLAVARVTQDLAGGAYGRRAVVLCGKGNNGGDGRVAARHLARWGMKVDLFTLNEASPNVDDITRSLTRADVAIDAIFGIGFRGSLEGAHAAAVEALGSSAAPVVAVDVPSGVEGDTGLVRGPAVTATVTVTFGAPKLGVILYPGASHAGRVEVADIGFPPDLLESKVRLVEAEDVRALLPRRSPEDHKRRSGIVVVVGGSRDMPGAPRLAALGAYRGGAGLVRVAAPASALPAMEAGIAEATFLGLPERDGVVTDKAWAILARESSGAMAVGPGLSTSDDAGRFVHRLVAEAEGPIVLDADGLNAFAGELGRIADRPSEAVLTPHTGELSRLLGIEVEEVLADRIGHARKAAAESRAVVLLKGARTVLASPDGDVRINPTGSPTLATGGTGDVLSGLVAAYLARGALPLEAATAAAFVHGLAGEMLEEGAVASDVADAIPEAAARIRS